MLKDLNKAIHAELVPPAALFEQSKASSQDVAYVAATSDIRGQRAIRYSNQDCPRMVQHDEHLFNGLDRCFKVIYGHINLIGQICPSLLDIIDFVDVQGARVWAKLLPNFLIDLHSSLRLEVFHGATERV